MRVKVTGIISSAPAAHDGLLPHRRHAAAIRITAVQIASNKRFTSGAAQLPRCFLRRYIRRETVEVCPPAACASSRLRGHAAYSFRISAGDKFLPREFARPPYEIQDSHDVTIHPGAPMIHHAERRNRSRRPLHRMA